MKPHLATWAVIAAVLVKSCGPPSRKATTDQNAKQAAIQPASLVDPAKVPRPCGDGGLTTDEMTGVNKEFELRTGPSRTADRIKNEKASSILGKVHYHVVDQSTTVRRLCRGKSWSEVQIVEPQWLNFVRGWTPNEVLRLIERDESGRRVYETRDFIWDGDTRAHRTQIVAAINKIVRENDRCNSIDTGTLSKSPSRSRPGKPVFFVTCNTGADVFNVWFEPSDVAAGRTFAATPNIAQAAALQACEAAVKSAATHPSTVRFSRVMDVAFTRHASGRSRLLSTFTAKNSFGLELKYRVSCLFDGYTLIESLIAENA